MDIVTPKTHAKPLLPHHMKDTPNRTMAPNPPSQIHLPLHRPQHKPPKPIRTRSRPSCPKGRPVTTTSDVLHLMDSLRLPVSLDIYTLLVRECVLSGDLSKAVELHEHVKRSRLRLGPHMHNRIMLMYVSCGSVGRARQLFDQMLVRDFISWAIVIAGYVENRQYDGAIELFVKLLREKGFKNADDIQMGFSVSGILICVLRACLHTMNFKLGLQVHGWLWKMGFSRSVALGSFLISYYGKAKFFERAESVYGQVPIKNTATWTSRIVNYCDDDKFKEVISIFKDMGRAGVRKNGYTFSAVLKACRKMGDIECGQQVHAQVMKLGLDLNGYIQYALVDLYGKCGVVKDSIQMFDMSGIKRGHACCDAMVMNYIQNELCLEVTEMLDKLKMKRKGKL